MKPIKLYAFLALFFLSACGSSDPFETMVTNADTIGAYPVTFSAERLDGKVSKCGYALRADASVPYDIDYHEVRPTLLSMIKQIHQDDRKCDWISVYLYTDGVDKYFQVGLAHYKNGKIEITTTIPSDKLIKVAQELQKQKTDPALKGQVDDVWGLPLYDPEYEAIRLPTIDEYNLGIKINARFYKLENQFADEDLKKVGASDEYLALSDTRFDRVYNAISTEFNIDETEIRHVKKICDTYYGLAYDSVTINPTR